MCPGCSVAVTDGVTVESGIKYHEKCVACATCTKSLVGGSINEIAGKLYCSVHAFEAKVRLVRFFFFAFTSSQSSP